MTLVFDSCVLADLALTEEDKHHPADDMVEEHICYITPISVAEAYQFIYSRSSQQRADHWLEVMLPQSKDGPVRIARDQMTDSGLIRFAALSMLEGVPATVAFTAALAKKLGCHVVMTSKFYSWYNTLEQRGICTIGKVIGRYR